MHQKNDKFETLDRVHQIRLAVLCCKGFHGELVKYSMKNKGSQSEIIDMVYWDFIKAKQPITQEERRAA